jgi:nucleoside-diphosphate-sugar epimerase
VYGKAKHALHSSLQNFAREFGVSYAWGRLFFLFGPHEPPQRFIPSIIRPLLRNEEAKTSHGEQIRDFMFVEDVGEAFVQLLDSDVSGAVNIASGSPLSLKDIAEMIAGIIGRPDLLRLGALEAPAGEPPILAADTSRLKDEVGFKTQADLRPALEKTINWWKDRL